MKIIVARKLDILFLLAILLIVFVLSNTYSVLLIRGESMYPTYTDKDILIVNKDKKREVGDIIVFQSPKTWSSGDKKFIKRIVAKGNDNVFISNDNLSVNGKVLASIKDKKCELGEPEKLTLKPGQYLVMGDNIRKSNDSITQLCNGNKNYIIEENEILMSGKEFKMLGGIFN